MIRHIGKIIWAQRRSNGWIWGELVIVMCALWFMIDRLWVDMRCYYAPLGYDITNTWRFKLASLSPQAPAYVPDSVSGADPVQDLLTLMERIRRIPEIEETCVTYWSMPYSFGNSWRSLFPLEGDTAGLGARSYHILRVSPEYFDLFRIKDQRGKAVTSLLADIHRPLVLTADAERLFFNGTSALGRQMSMNDDLSYPFTVAAVVPTFRSNDFDRPEQCAFEILKSDELVSTVRTFGVSKAELSVRTRQPMTDDEMFAFLKRVGSQLRANNYYVYGVKRIAGQRAEQLAYRMKENRTKLSVMTFLLMNVFFGVVGTFWLRTERRRSEIGLRMAIGSSRRRLGQQMYLEGLLLLTATVPVWSLFAYNMIFLDKLDVYREPLTLFRLAATFGGSYLLMAGMICLGIWLPVRKAVRMAPAEVLHYE